MWVQGKQRGEQEALDRRAGVVHFWISGTWNETRLHLSAARASVDAPKMFTHLY